MNLIIRLSIFFVIILIGCSRKTISVTGYYKENIPKIEYCDLPNHENELVYIKCVYSGVDEYWSLNPLGRGCKSLMVELDSYLNGNSIPEKYKKYFESVQSSYWNSYLILEMTGRYESKKNGYGHLGTNKSRFILSEIVNVKLVKRDEQE
jgi:hypothetical protein